MEIKTTLKQLTALFAQSASTEELPVPIRRFAAQLTILTAHVQRVDAKIDALATSTDGHVAELAQHIIALKPKSAESASEVPAAIDEERGAGAADIEGLDEEEAAQLMAEKTLRETEAEARAIAAANGKPAAVVPLRPNGQQSTTTEEAS